MKKIFALMLALVVGGASLSAQTVAPKDMPRSIYGGLWRAGHVQGIALDTEHKHIYYSFTTMLVKTDLQGNVIGTRLHEAGIASNRGSAYRGEYVPGLCTHRPSNHES